MNCLIPPFAAILLASALAGAAVSLTGCKSIVGCDRRTEIVHDEKKAESLRRAGAKCEQLYSTDPFGNPYPDAYRCTWCR